MVAPHTQARRDRLPRLSVLIPLQASALIRLGIQVNQPEQLRVERLRSIRDAISRSRDQEQIIQALRDLPGCPQIPAGFSRPMDAFRRDAIHLINERLELMEREMQVAQRFRRVGDALLFLRLAGISAILSGVFAAFSMRREERGSWLEQLVWMRASAAERRHERALARSQSAWFDPSLHDQARQDGAGEEDLEGSSSMHPQ